jgi:hypothetical protein
VGSDFSIILFDKKKKLLVILNFLQGLPFYFLTSRTRVLKSHKICTVSRVERKKTTKLIINIFLKLDIKNPRNKFVYL